MKKLFALVLALALTVLSVSAFAAGSKTTSDTTYVNVPAVEEETEDALAIESVDEEESEAVTELKEEFASKKASEVVVKIENSDVALEETAELVELVELNVTGTVKGDVTATLTVPTEIKEGDEVRVLVKIGDKWYEVESKVTGEGKVEIVLTEEILELMEAAEAPVIAVFKI